MQVVRQRTWTDEDLAALFDRFFPSLYDVAVRVLGSPADAGAAVGHAFVRARAELERRPIDELRPWVFGLLAAELPRRRPAHTSETDEYATLDADRLANPQAVLRNGRIPDEVWATVSTLPVQDYLLLDLQLRHGLRDPELSRALRVDPRSLEARLERLRDRLDEAVDSPISPVAVFAALAPVQPPPELQREVWAGILAPAPTPKRERTPIGLPPKPIVIAAAIALLAAAATVGAFIASRSPGVHDPSSVHSTSHSTEQGSSNPDVEIAWDPNTDARGYSVSWAPQPAEPDKTVDLPGGATGTTGHLKPGTHWFNLRTLGSNGRWTGTVHLGPFLILPDTVVPETTIDSGPRKYGTPAATFEFSSNEPDATLECSLDGQKFRLCASPKTYTGLGKGKHTFRVRAVDGAGNTDPTPAHRTWQVDTKPPNTKLTKAPDDYAQGKARFTFTSTQKKSTFECKLDGARFRACSSPKRYSNLSDGKHHFRVRAIDRAGNPDPSPATLKWTVDTVPPETTIDSGPNGISRKGTAKFSISSEAGASIACKLDGQPWSDCGSISGLEDGKHVLKARATDRAGNVDPTPARWTWRVALPPKTTITAGPSGPTSSTAATFQFSSDGIGATFKCRLDGGTWAACAAGKTYSSLSQGKHTFLVRAKAASGTVDPSPAKRTWKVDTIAPDTTITSGPKLSTGSSSASFTFSSSESGVTFECRLDGTSWQACSSPKSYTGLEKKKKHTFRVRAVDAAGNIDASPDTWGWTVQ
jgi:DNA-directed RNA polymerase specialized sigma24 family protein